MPTPRCPGCTIPDPAGCSPSARETCATAMPEARVVLELWARGFHAAELAAWARHALTRGRGLLSGDGEVAVVIRLPEGG